jgi:phosphoribosylanthranilate isomerase
VIKGTIVLVIAFKLLSFLDRNVHDLAENFITRHGINSANRVVHAALERLVGIGNTQLIELSVGAVVYSASLYLEGIGLWLQKRWAEYLTTILTALLIPLEIYEAIEKFTFVRILILAFNVFIVWYLSTRLLDESNENRSLTRTEPPLIKICGITNLQDAELSAKAGADQIGFNFYPKSPRYIEPGDARLMVDSLPKKISKVGVFVDESVESVCGIIDKVGLDAVQLHGNEDRAFISKLKRDRRVTVIKALRVSADFSPERSLDFGADAILLDSFSENSLGGTGKTFDWEVASSVIELIPRVYLAGGLTPENVGDAINKIRPYAVDICSRIESEPGKKDPAKLSAFIAAVKGAK